MVSPCTEKRNIFNREWFLARIQTVDGVLSITFEFAKTDHSFASFRDITKA